MPCRFTDGVRASGVIPRRGALYWPHSRQRQHEVEDAGGAMADIVPVAEIRLSEERKAALAPKLQVLLEEFGRLTELERPDLEPSAPRRPEEEDAHASR